MTPEGAVQAYLIKEVKRCGGQCRRLQWIGRRGAPDVMCWWAGMLIFVEVKSEHGRLTKLQEQEHENMRSTGLKVYVVHSKVEVDLLIEELRG